MPNVVVRSTSGATTWPVDYYEYARHMVSGAVLDMQLTCSCIFL